MELWIHIYIFYKKDYTVIPIIIVVLSGMAHDIPKPTLVGLLWICCHTSAALSLYNAVALSI